MQKELSIRELFRVFKRSWWKMLIFALIAMIAAGTYTYYMIPERFSSSIKFYIRNEQNNTDYINPALLTGSDQLANNYISIINGDRCIFDIKNALEADGILKSTGDIRGMLSASKESDTSIFTVRVSGTDAAEAYAVATLIAQRAPDIITETAKLNSNTVIYGTVAEVDDRNYADFIGHQAAIRVDKTPCVEVINNPVEDTEPDSPSIPRNVLLAGFVTAIIVYIVVLLLSLLDTAIRTEEDVKKCIDVPVLGVIPSWNDKANRNYDHYKHYTNQEKENQDEK